MIYFRNIRKFLIFCVFICFIQFFIIFRTLSVKHDDIYMGKFYAQPVEQSRASMRVSCFHLVKYQFFISIDILLLLCIKIHSMLFVYILLFSNE